MKSNKMTEFFGNVWDSAKKNSPQLLTGLAVAGLITTSIMAWKAGPKAQKIMEEKKQDLRDTDPDDKKTKRTVVLEAVKEMTPVVLPTVLMGGATAACIVGANKESSRRIAVLSAAYSLSEKTVKDLNTKMVEQLGEKKARSIKDAIAKDKMEKDPPSENTQVIMTGDGDVLCRDSYSGRYFRSSHQKIGQAINQLSHDLQSDMYVCLNDFYDLIGLDPVPLGEDFGWNVDDMIRGQLAITITSALTPDNRPCLCVDYDIAPRADFRDLH